MRSPAEPASWRPATSKDRIHSQGAQQIHPFCVNNWQWGRKDLLLKADAAAGRAGTVQRIQVRGITSGGMQFFYTQLKLKKDRFYKISYWLKSEGLEGPIRAYVRKGGHPWTVYVHGDYEPRTSEWQEYSFTGRCTEDVDEDVGVCWETGSIGTIWLDDLKVEEAERPFPPAAPMRLAPEPAGNFLPRSSFEGTRDHLWCQAFFGWNRNGVWEGVEGDWEDPQMYRSAEGKFGKYCLAVPNAKHAGQPSCHSTLFNLLPGKPYTVSVWMKSDPPGLPGSIALQYWWSGRHQQAVAAAYPRLTAEWQRVSFTATPLPPPGSDDTILPIQALIQIAPAAVEHGTVFVDGLQLEAGEKATDYEPRYPLELYADLVQPDWTLPGPAPALAEWGKAVPLEILAAAAGASALKQSKVELTLTGYPDVLERREILQLTVGQPMRLDLTLQRRGLFRVSLRTLNQQEAAPQEMLFAVVPKPRETGIRGMFGQHIALRPFHAHYIRRLGFTWIEHKKAGVDKFFVYQMHNTDSLMYFGGYQSLYLGYDRSPTPAAVATAVTAYCIDGLRSVPCPPVVGIVEGLFEGDGRATWAVYDDSAVAGRRRLNLTKLSPDLEVLDVMGNDPRATGKTEWEIGIQPLFVMSPKLKPAELLALTRDAVQ